MRTRILPALALAAVLAATANRAAADDPKLPDARTFDKLVVDTLRDVHNTGAELYNTSRDYAGAYRIYQGALLTTRPLLAHRPDAQKRIDTGLGAAAKEADAARKAFLLHETIEAVRKDLKAAVAEKKPDEPKTTVETPKKVDEPKKVVEPPKKVEEPKKVVEPPKKPAEVLPVAPLPREVAPKAKAAPGARVSGNVTVDGKPLAAGELTLTSTAKQVQTFTTTIKDGKYVFADPLPPGKYAGAVTGKGVPAKYATAATSGLTFEFVVGPTTIDVVLK